MILLLFVPCLILCFFFCICIPRYVEHNALSIYSQTLSSTLFNHAFRRRSDSYREVDVTSFDLYQREMDQYEAGHPCPNAPEHQGTNQNQDSDQDYNRQTPPQEHVIHENLSLTPAPIPGPIIDQDRLEWFTETCKMTDNNMEDALEKEDSLTYSRETQILLPTSGPPIDPYNTR